MSVDPIRRSNIYLNLNHTKSLEHIAFITVHLQRKIADLYTHFVYIICTPSACSKMYVYKYMTVVKCTS